MKTLLLSILFFAFSAIPIISNAQKHEIGFAIGALNYKGDIAQNLNFTFSRPGINGFYRHNFNPTWAVKLSLTGGKIYGSDDPSDDPLPTFRQLEMSALLVEFAAMGEYNFFNYRKEGDRRRFSPYLTGGLGFFAFSQDIAQKKEVSDGSGLAIPFGVGIKYRTSRKTNLSIEFVARKTFTDNIDGITSRTSPNGLQIADPYNNDWYYFTGFTFSYTFYGIDCPKHFK